MPYITPVQRAVYDRIPDKGALGVIIAELQHRQDDELAGHLNYLFTALVHGSMLHKEKHYHRYNAIIGALECCKQELYRRHIGPHEDKAIERNGDVL